MSKLIIASLLLTAIAGAPATAAIVAVEVPSPAGGAVKSVDASPQKICRWVERSGSHAKQKFCLTKEEWQQVDADRD